MREWLVQVFILTSMSLLNNWAFAFHVPLTLQIVFRSAGQSFLTRPPKVNLSTCRAVTGADATRALRSQASLCP